MDSNPLINAMDPSITLWQFLLHLLEDARQRHLITWTGEDGEFKLLDAEEVARLWGLRKNKHNMNYDKLSRALRYYYDKNIIKKVSGQKFVYRFVGHPDALLLEGQRAGVEGERRDNDDPNGQSKSPEGLASCPSKSLLQRSSPNNTQKSCRNDYMKSGLYSTFTIQSLQASPPSRPIKAELLLSQEPSAKVDRTHREVLLELKSSQPLGGAAVDGGLHVIVTQSSPCPTPALSPQTAASSTVQPQVYLPGGSREVAALSPFIPLGHLPPHLPLPPGESPPGLPHPAHPPHPPTPVFVVINPHQHQAAMATGPSTLAPPPPVIIKEEKLPSEEELLEMEEEKDPEPLPGLEDGDPEPPPLSIVESPPTPSPSPTMEPTALKPPGGEEEEEEEEERAQHAESSAPLPVLSGAVPPRPKKPRGLELPSSPSSPCLLHAGLSLDKVNAAVNSLLAPGPGTNTLTPTVITSHALTPVLLTPSPLPSTIHFWSTLSPIAPRSPAKLSFQFPTNGTNQIHIPALSVDGLSTPVVLSPGPQKP